MTDQQTRTPAHVQSVLSDQHAKLDIVNLAPNQTNYLQTPAFNPQTAASRPFQPRPTFERIRLATLVVVVLSILLGLGLTFALVLALVIALLRQSIRPLVKSVLRTTLEAAEGTGYDSTCSTSL